jgi:hypothetical protein
MRWTEFWTGIGNFFELCFKLMRKLGHLPNLFFWSVVVFLLAYWAYNITRFKKEARQNGTLE